METVTVSKFRTTCLGIIRQVEKTGVPVLVTRSGKPLVQIVPAASPRTSKRVLGTMRDTVEFTGDVVSPVFPGIE